MWPLLPGAVLWESENMLDPRTASSRLFSGSWLCGTEGLFVFVRAEMRLEAMALIVVIKKSPNTESANETQTVAL
jgi:hypothetical protein